MATSCNFPKCECFPNSHPDLANDGTPYICPAKYEGKMKETWTEVKALPETAVCSKCSEPINGAAHYWIINLQEKGVVYLHDRCYNTYEHYYGYNKPID